MFVSLRRATVGIVLALAASSALAFTVSELLDRAATLEESYASLISRANACPDGACGDAVDIVADAATTDAAFAELEADRATLNPCTTCSTLDATIVDVETAAQTLRTILGGWDGQG